MFSVVNSIIAILRARFYQICFAGFQVTGLCRLETGTKLYIKQGRISLGRNTYISRFTDLISINGNIVIAGDFFCNKGCVLSSRSSVYVGAGCRFGEYVSIYDNNHKFSKHSGVASDIYNTEPVVIGENCWICRGAVVLAGVRIGDNCLVGPNVVVRNSILSGTILLENN